MRQVDGEGVLAAVLPVILLDGEAGLLAAICQVWRNVDLDTRLLREPGRLGVASRDQDAAVRKELSTMVMSD